MMKRSNWKQKELACLVLYAAVFYWIVIWRSLQLSHDHFSKLHGLLPGWIPDRLNDVSDAQWRNFRGNLTILTAVFGFFSFAASIIRKSFSLKANGMSMVWTALSLAYLLYLHGACVIFILGIASSNFLLVKLLWGLCYSPSTLILNVKVYVTTNNPHTLCGGYVYGSCVSKFLKRSFLIFGRTKYFLLMLWIFNLSFLVCNRICEGYSFSSFGSYWAYLDNFRGSFRWHICFNFVVLRMLSFGYDYHWADKFKSFNQKHCDYCASGRTCYAALQETRVADDKFSYSIYLCYLLYCPLYIAGPIVGFNAFASQLDSPQNIYSNWDVFLYGLRWTCSFLLMELMTHLFYYNAFATSGLWKQLSPLDIFIIGYGVLNFMWLKFFLIWRYFRFWSMINGVAVPENMPRCINNCHNLETFWKSWHASFNKWLVRYVYIPLGGSRKKLLNVWFIFTFVAVWHDLEWKLLSWAWLTCIFFIPEMIVKSLARSYQVESAFGEFIFRELTAISGAVTITCLMVANLVGFVIGPSGINWLFSGFLQEGGLPTLGGLLISFYVGTKLMLHISDAKQKKDKTR